MFFPKVPLEIYFTSTLRRVYILKFHENHTEIVHFTVVRSVTGLLTGSDAAGDRVLMQTSMILACKLGFFSVNYI